MIFLSKCLKWYVRPRCPISFLNSGLNEYIFLIFSANLFKSPVGLTKPQPIVLLTSFLTSPSIARTIGLPAAMYDITFAGIVASNNSLFTKQPINASAMHVYLGISSIRFKAFEKEITLKISL